MKWIIKTVLFLIIIGALGVVFVLNPYLKREAVVRVEEASGFPAELNYLGLSLKKGGVMIKDFELKNPAGYPIENALTVNEVSAVPKVISFALRKPRFKSMVLDIPELNIVTRADGQNNFKQLAANLKAFSDQLPKKEKGDKESSEPTKKSESLPIHIDHLELRLGQAVIYEFKEGLEEPTRVTLNLDISKTYEDVEDLSVVMSDVFASVMQRTLGSVLSKELGGLFKKMEEKNPETAEDIKNAAEVIGGQLKGLFESME